MKYKILIDAVFIHVGGGKTLLEHIINQLENFSEDVYYLLDKRIQKHNYKFLKKTNINYVRGSMFERHGFYKNNKNSFKRVLCLTNIPPTVKLNAVVYTLLQQYSYLKLPSGESTINKINWFAKSLILKKYQKYTDKWIVQSENMKSELGNKYSIKNDKIICIPFFDSKKMEKIKTFKKKKNKFVYVSFAYSYKNHINLIKAFTLAYKKSQKGELHLTVSKENKKLINQIKLNRKKGIPIYNHGIINSDQVSKLYSNSEFLIFPSTMESFGLPLIEAIYHQCKVLVSDLPFANAICKPSFKFDPYDIISIADALINSMSSKSNKSELIIKDQTLDLINLLS